MKGDYFDKNWKRVSNSLGINAKPSNRSEIKKAYVGYRRSHKKTQPEALQMALVWFKESR